MSNKVVTRMAPSPTGHLHIGTARAALFNFLYAKRYGGKFLLRSEDTDKERGKKEYEDEIIEGLKILGISHDGFVRQSERVGEHTKYLTRIIEEDKAYISEEESKDRPGEMVSLVRLRNPGRKISFMDEIRGEITFDTTELGDLIIARSIDDPLYHFAVVADDFDMGVTHVIRGEDHISNTPRQILIQEAIGAPRPIYAHLPLILAPDRSKLSKRHGAVALEDYLADGFLPEAIVNYLALLGWNPGTDQEIFTMGELVKQFSFEGIQRSGAIFDRQKLLWFNKQHLDRLPDSEYFNVMESAVTESVKNLKDYSEERLQKLLPVFREHYNLKNEMVSAFESGEYDFAFADPDVPLELLKWRKDADVKVSLPRLERCAEILKEADFGSSDTIKIVIWPYAEEVGKGEVLWPLRVALTGMEKSPDPFTVAYIIGKEPTLKRLENAMLKLSSDA